jgi:hypothetical protein
MQNLKQRASQSLLEQGFITEEQLIEIKSYRSRTIFSLHNELKLFLYLAVLSFTTGIGILIYQNIDTIGHVAILTILLILTLVCYYFSFKNSSGFRREETSFENQFTITSF